MAEKTISIGGLEDVIIYNDAETDYAFDTDGIVRASDYRSGVGVGQSTAFTFVTDSRMNGAQLQKKTKTLTFTKGILTNVGAESDWTDTTDI